MRGQLKSVFENHIKDAGEVKEGVQRASRQIVTEFMQDPKFNPEKVSIRELFDETVLREHPELDINTAKAGRIAEAIGSSQFSYITGELISKVLLPSYNNSLNGVDQLVTEGETKKDKYEYIAGMRAVSKLQRVYPGQNYPSAQWGEKNIRIEIAKFGEILDLEKELVLSDQTGEVLNRARTAGDVMGQHRHQFIVQTLMDIARTALEEASSTALYFNGSAVTVYANTHATVADDGQVNDNLAASSAITSTTSWDTVYGLFGVMKDEEGKPITVIPNAVLTHPSTFRKAWAQTSDMNLAEVGSANRGSNFYAQKLHMSAFESPFVGTGGGATTDWYMGDFKKAAQWLWYWRPSVDEEGMNSTAAFERDVVARFKYSYSGGCGLKDYRYIVKATA